MQSCLRGEEEEQTARERLIHTIADDPKLVANLLKAGPKLLRSRYANFVPQVLSAMGDEFCDARWSYARALCNRAWVFLARLT